MFPSPAGVTLFSEGRTLAPVLADPIREVREAVDHLRVGEQEPRGGDPAGEERRAAAERHGRDVKLDLVQESCVGEPADQLAAADEPDVVPGRRRGHLCVDPPDVALDEADVRVRDPREVPVGEHPARDVTVELVPSRRMFEQLLVVEHPLVRRRAHRHGTDGADECLQRSSPWVSSWASKSQSSEFSSSAMNPSMLVAVKYCVLPPLGAAGVASGFGPPTGGIGAPSALASASRRSIPFVRLPTMMRLGTVCASRTWIHSAKRRLCPGRTGNNRPHEPEGERWVRSRHNMAASTPFSCLRRTTSGSSNCSAASRGCRSTLPTSDSPSCGSSPKASRGTPRPRSRSSTRRSEMRCRTVTRSWTRALTITTRSRSCWSRSTTHLHLTAG